MGRSVDGTRSGTRSIRRRCTGGWRPRAGSICTAGLASGSRPARTSERPRRRRNWPYISSRAGIWIAPYATGEVATRRSAAREAVEHLTRALDLLGAHPDTPARARDEVALQIALGGPLMALRGRGAPEVEQAYLRAQA